MYVYRFGSHRTNCSVIRNGTHTDRAGQTDIELIKSGTVVICLFKFGQKLVYITEYISGPVSCKFEDLLLISGVQVELCPH